MKNPQESFKNLWSREKGETLLFVESILKLLCVVFFFVVSFSSSFPSPSPFSLSFSAFIVRIERLCNVSVGCFVDFLWLSLTSRASSMLRKTRTFIVDNEVSEVHVGGTLVSFERRFDNCNPCLWCLCQTLNFNE